MMEKMETKTQEKSGITRRKTSQYVKFCPKDERNASLKKVSIILQKAENERTVEEQQVLCEYSEIVIDLKQRWQRRDEAKRRLEEVEEPQDVLEEKCRILAKALAQSEHLVIYTGAGISTAARIPDYRGTNGIWTRLQQGKDIGNHDLSLAEPTYTHMALSQLYHQKHLKYIVSQNCDGLHLRSGLPRSALSELHGNMYVEVCKNCKPVREFWRLFDVTEKTARFSHKTMRRCYACSKELFDTIVHFGERGTLQWPLNWSGACKNADAADTILCLGSSLKVLKRYPWLWQMNKPAKKRPNLYIVNLQWTPKDDCAVMKINGKCDEVMLQVMKLLGLEVPRYDRDKDPIFAHSTFLCSSELHTTSQPSLKTSEIKNEIVDSDECKSEIIKEEIIEVKNEEIDEKDIDNSINLFQDEQNEAYDLTVTKRIVEADTTVSVLNNSNCDNFSRNTHLNAIKSQSIGSSSINTTHSALALPKRKSNSLDVFPSKISNASVFSIDSILNKSEKNVSLVSNCSKRSDKTLQVTNFQNNSTGNNLQSTLMAYYEFANTVLQNQMLSYLTTGLYPLQTSLLYPGFHSIINPVPYFTYDFDSSTIDPQSNMLIKNEIITKEVIEEKPKVPTCSFCHKTYESYSCLFYTRTEPVFLKQLYRFSKLKNCNKELVCVCCDYTTEEESDSDNNENKTDSKSKKNLKRKCENDVNIDCDKGEDICEESENFHEICDDPNKKIEKTEIKTGKTQAGWFGKGYRKNRKPKKKQY